MLRDGVAGLARAFFYAGAASVVSTLSARGRSRKDGFPTVGAVCDRPHFVNSRKKARSQTAPTIDTANSADFCHGLLDKVATLTESATLTTPLLPALSCRVAELFRGIPKSE